LKNRALQKDCELSFSECSIPKSASKANDKHNKVDWVVLRKNDALSLHKASYSKSTKAPLPSFVTSSKGLLQEESDLPRVCTSNVFNPNACKLMEKFGYEFSEPPSLGHVIEEKPYGLNDMQKIIQR